ncbi:N-acyl-D-amino-acid deacylase family protein [Chryseolinea lacunae]|uniref:D-aminoacylase n=1 Tax=Chryseolinea lacunae TaxID=2801331 RepID=A0ABS1KL57_9BACT|nr:D-aminoacylase [Chryseolinea lacunae]MBL0740184.1 D-aminoacylase [Chryseolinea lacunae]
MRAILVLLFAMVLIHPLLAQPYDLVLINGKILDGSGNSWFYGDVAIRNGKIVAVGKIVSPDARKVLDVKGLIVAPGFVDVHTHIEGNDLKVPMAGNFVFDGVTSVVTGNCGSSNTALDHYFMQLDSVKTSVNVATLVGHNSVRRAVMGDAQRDPSADEQKQMEALVAKAMRDGAVGFSTGLIYVPGTYSKTPEVIGLAKAAAQYNGVYASHIRDEGDHVTEAIEEAINIGRQANMPVEISHFKVTYKPNWGKSVNTLAQVEKARRDGIDVTIDQYPYVASSTTLNTVLPSWAFSGGDDSLQYRLKTPAIRAKIKTEMLETLKRKLLKSYSYAVVARYGADTTVNGKTISEVNVLKGRKPKAADEAETILEMVAKGSAQMVYFSMNESDLKNIMQYPYNMFASDAGIARFGSGVPHPRAYGTNARVLGQYVRELHVITLEEAVRRMTSLPAQKFQLRDRGMIREGLAADIVVFDEKTVGDKSTFSQPHSFSTGFRHVIVNGQLVIEDGKHNGTRSGVVLHGPGYATTSKP